MVDMHGEAHRSRIHLGLVLVGASILVCQLPTPPHYWCGAHLHLGGHMDDPFKRLLQFFSYRKCLGSCISLLYSQQERSLFDPETIFSHPFVYNPLSGKISK